MFKILHCILEKIEEYKRTHIRDKQYFDNSGYSHMELYVHLSDYCEDSIDMPWPDLSSMEGPYTLSSELKELTIPRISRDFIDKEYGPEKYQGGLTYFKVEEGVTNIGQEAFAYNLNLREIILPSSLKKIGSGAFTTCNKLVSIVIPTNVIKIGNDAFPYNLKELHLQANLPPRINALGISCSCRIYIPKDKVQLYLNHKKWRKHQEKFIAV